MNESGFVEEAPASAAAGTRPRPRLRWVLPTLLVLGLLVLPGFAVWSHFGRVHAEDVAAHEELVEELRVMDRYLQPLSHGTTGPCVDGTEGAVDRSYSGLTGPTADEIREHLVEAGWAATGAAPPADARLVRPSSVPDHELVIVLETDSPDSSAGQGVRLHATSSASRLACAVRG